ncbi:MAG: asparagine--tRNA ligase [Spirochaetia bacterium]
MEQWKTIASLFADLPLGSIVCAHGWVRSVRDGKNVAFITLNDGSCFASLQAVADKSTLGEDIVQGINTGASVRIEGTLVKSEGGGQSIELSATKITLLGGSDNTYPLQKKSHTLEFLREIPHLRGRTNTLGALMRLRSQVSFAIHKFFHQHQFHYIHTPIITGSDCEGAGEMFQVTTLPIEKQSSKAVDYHKDFFGKKTHLTVSGQLNVEAYCQALGRVYTFGPTFRAENSNTPRHLSEFWMIEPEMAFCDLEGNIALAHAMLIYLVEYVLQHGQQDLAFFDKMMRPGLLEELKTFTTSPLSCMTYDEAIAHLEKSGKTFEYPCYWGVDLKSEHERYLCEEVIKGPLAITDYPKEIKSFYMKLSPDQRTVRCVDIIVPGIGEIIGGSQREDVYEILASRMQGMGLSTEEYQWYLDLRRYGSVPHSGFGLGLERFLMYITGISNIRDTIPYPRAPHLCDC